MRVFHVLCDNVGDDLLAGCGFGDVVLKEGSQVSVRGEVGLGDELIVQMLENRETTDIVRE